MRSKLVLLSFAAALPLLLIAPSSYAAYEWGFGDISLNRLFWSPGTQRKSTKKDFNYLELEGAAQFNWGELYGFFDLERPEDGGYYNRTASKAVGRYYLGDTHLSIYAHVYEFIEKGFTDQTRVLGIGYQLVGKGWWFKPFLGFTEVSQTFFNGMNGYMFGWSAGYNFKIAKEDFVVVSWHELEFARKPNYNTIYKGNASSQNGALGLWWNAIPQITTGLQWRYAVDKLGTPGYIGATIASIRYNF